MTLEEAFQYIYTALGDVDDILEKGLPNGTNADWGFDEQLVLEIGEACLRWDARVIDKATEVE